MKSIAPKTLKYDPIVYSLETPKYHLLKFDTTNNFSGWVFNFGDKKIDSINVYNDSQFLGNFRVDLPRADIAGYVPSIPAAKNCGFAFNLNVESCSDKLTFDIVFDDSSTELFFEFDIASGFRQQEYFARQRSISQPNGDLVYLTQGHYNVDEYQNSIIPAVVNMRNYLEQSGVNLSKINSLLDFGCGSARLLVGWHLIVPMINDLHGCDLNEKLLSWAQENLPEQIKCLKSNLMPPLPYSDNQFELIYLISVFTHISLDAQKSWVQEFKRILKVGSHILLTLHGELYVRNHFWRENQKIEAFLNKGYIENNSSSEEGSNIYGTFHMPAVVEKLFQGFQLVGYFPNGRINHQRTLFQIAQSQDVYIFKYLGD